ncbi:hypothetical protein HH1059_09640 [Halorhodospira halochloris]|uniref:Uncharacterized protein n=1 Tax=Halorhodospira halochloris TaxID=1052 RepID=A0A110B584_HALHR|nr:hypothetical protein [Halorhodospira halochloris]MBK1651371.1 hypothetical protein [Halorhodospira halochloris]BAU57658.1 hypothetical protein HH1059_09640 [Halorhodospira halochloris]
MARADAIWKRLRKSRDNPAWEDSSERGETRRWSGDTIEGEIADVELPRRRDYEQEIEAEFEEYKHPGDERGPEGHHHNDDGDYAEEVDVNEWAREQRRKFAGQTSNYLLSFGFPGSGKTTFQSFLVYYLTHIGPFDAHPRINPLGNAQGWDPMVTFNEWIRLWHQGKFPPANPVDERDIRELAFDIQPLQGKRQPPLELSLVEVSGEFMARVIAERDHDPDLVDAVADLFGDDQINLTLVFIIDPDHGDENDVLFQNLVTFLDVHFPGARERMSLAIMISKPEASLQLLQSRYSEYSNHTELRGDLCEDYVRLMAPRTHRILDSWPSLQRVQLMTLHLGELGSQDGEPRVHRIDYTDIEAIFGWLYSQFTGSGLGPSVWQQFLEWLRR